MTYNVVELLISSGFWFLVGFAIAKARPKDALREAFYKVRPDLKPDMTFTVDGKLEILWYRFSDANVTILVTAVTDENREWLNKVYDVRARTEEYVALLDNDPFVVNAESFHKSYKRVLPT